MATAPIKISFFMKFSFDEIKNYVVCADNEKLENFEKSARYTMNNTKAKTVLILEAPFIFTATRSGGIDILKRKSLWIDNGVIADICSSNEASKYKNKADIIFDASYKGGVAITPGFINTHAHSHMYLMRSTMLLEDSEGIDKTIRDMPKWQQFETDESMFIAAIGDVTEQQKSGITTTLSHGPSFEAIEQTAVFTKQQLVNAISAISNSRPSNTPEQAEKYIKEKQKFASIPAVSIHYLYKADDKILEKIKELVSSYGVLFTFHLAESEEVRNQSIEKFGRTEIERLEKAGLLNYNTLCSHSIHLTSGEIKKLVESKVGIAHLPTSNAIHKSGTFDYSQFYNFGGKDYISLGTDSVISKNRLDLLSEAFQTKLTHLEAHSLTYAKLFKMITINGARVLGLKKVGIIEPGYRADIAFWKLKDRGFFPYDENNPHTLIGNMITHGGRNIRDLMINGEFVISNRRHNIISESKLLELIQRYHMHIREQFNAIPSF